MYFFCIFRQSTPVVLLVVLVRDEFFICDVNTKKKSSLSENGEKCRKNYFLCPIIYHPCV